MDTKYEIINSNRSILVKLCTTASLFVIVDKLVKLILGRNKYFKIKYSFNFNDFTKTSIKKINDN